MIKIKRLKIIYKDIIIELKILFTFNLLNKNPILYDFIFNTYINIISSNFSNSLRITCYYKYRKNLIIKYFKNNKLKYYKDLPLDFNWIPKEHRINNYKKRLITTIYYSFSLIY